MSDNTMKAVRFHDYGGPQVLVLEDVPCPQPKEDQVLVRVLAAGVNPADWKMRSGMYRAFMQLPLPFTSGLEMAGIVEATGSSASGFKKGQAVFGPAAGAYAEYVVAPEKELQSKPASLSFEEAASIPVGALTAWEAIDAVQVQPGQRVLVHGAAGGVGLYAAQLAHWKGASVLGTASASNLQFVRSLGVDEVIDYNAAPFETVVHDLDAVIDTVGGDIPERSLKTLRSGGILVTVAARLPEEFGKAQGVRAIGGRGRAPADKLAEITRLIEEKKIRPAVGRVFPLAEARQAHELSQSGHGRGRIILRVAG